MNKLSIEEAQGTQTFFDDILDFFNMFINYFLTLLGIMEEKPAATEGSSEA